MKEEDEKIVGLIRRFLRPAGELPDPDGIAAPAFLYSLLAVVCGLLASLKLAGLRLSDAERQRLSNKDPTAQRQRARGFLRLSRNRPRTVARAGFDAGTYQGFIGRDRALDLLFATLDQIVAVLNDGLLQLSAALTDESGRVWRQVQEVLGSADTAPELRRRVRVAFDAVDYQAAQGRAREQAARRESKNKPRAGQGAAAPDAPAQQAGAGRLVQAAVPGRDPEPGRPGKKGRRREVLMAAKVPGVLNGLRGFGRGGPAAGADGLTRRALSPFGRGAEVLSSFVAFMALPGATLTDVALKLAEIVESTGVQGLADALRRRVGLQIDEEGLLLVDDVIEALEECPAIGERAGVKARTMAARVAQGDEIRGLLWLFSEAQARVGDARLLVQAWLFTAEQALSLEVFREMTAAAGQELWQLLGDAGPALEFLEEDLERRQADLRKSGKAIAGLQEQLDQIEGDIELLKTMQRVRAQPPPARAAALDENTLRAAARRFAERMARP